MSEEFYAPNLPDKEEEFLGYQGEIIPMYPTDVPEDIELQFDDPHLTKANSLYLTLQQEYFEQIVAGTKTVEYRQIKDTTFKKYLVCDEQGPIPYGDDIDWPEFQGADLCVYNHGKFPFLVAQDINFLRFKAGATAHDMDSCVVEVDCVKLTPQERFDITPEGKVKRNPEGDFCVWVIEFHLGRVRGVHRKAKK